MSASRCSEGKVDIIFVNDFNSLDVIAPSVFTACSAIISPETVAPARVGDSIASFRPLAMDGSRFSASRIPGRSRNFRTAFNVCSEVSDLSRTSTLSCESISFRPSSPPRLCSALILASVAWCGPMAAKALIDSTRFSGLFSL